MWLSQNTDSSQGLVTPPPPSMYIKYKGILHETVGNMNGFHKTILRENSRLKQP